ncbi:DNA gyrase inhibitor YacG [Falsiroseomonas sp. CW058]|uniref:DNA gyrase inhibitor YacG n=1 Tax=Falsiroseomonas sp. CW058 TaxID=3388664 RepID=UPI003D30FF53
MSTTPKPRPPRRCPICAKPLEQAGRRFCSDRCAQVDLGRWLKGDYAIPAGPEEMREEE